ncbi:hypothetical protein VB712_10780, partial [Spirulina sp. CCNP1310]|uniref:hypothetical protein n=1 Tax=Spirulina sp. CCNP1310 TaxID=3110249 RepID=UPI002B20BB17
FLVDPLVQSVAPFTRSLIFPSMVTLADFSVPKLVFGTILVGALWRRLQRAPGHAVRRLATGCLAVLAVVAALAALGLLPIVNLQNPTLIRLSFGFFLADLPGPFGTEYVYAAALLVAAGVLCTAALKCSAPRAATLLCAGIVTAFGAHEVVNGRFNRAELSPSQRAAYEWIGRSGDPAETLVLTSSQRDIAVEDEVANVAGVAPDGRPYDWSLPWLPVISDRGAVFNRGNYVARFTGSMPLVAGEPPPLAALDRAYWHPADPESLALMRAWGVTHIYVPDRHQAILADALARAAGVTRVFATPSDDWPTRENVVYRVEPAT